MDLRLNFVSNICWEIITDHKIHVNWETFPVFKLLLDLLYDFCPTIFERNLRIYWRYSPEGFLKIGDYFSFCAFLNLTVEPNLYLVIDDAEKFYSDTEKFLKILDLMELQQVKTAERDKYDLRCEAEEIGEEIKKCQESLDLSSTSEYEINDDTDILKFALRKMPIGRCYTADICSGYSIIDCVRKAMKGRIINCSPHQDIYFLETHAKNEENNIENLFVSPAGREMLKYKPNTKLKQKTNPNLEFFTSIHNNNRQSISSQESNKSNDKCDAVSSSTSQVTSPVHPSTSSSSDSHHKSSIDLYEEAAAILGLSCSQTDDCRCIECQCHYFDFEEEIDFPTAGNEYGGGGGKQQLLKVDHTSSCSIQ